MSVHDVATVVRMGDAAEHKIQKILLDLNEELADYGVRVDHVDVDTRRWCNMRVTLFIDVADGRPPPPIAGAQAAT